jgi:hypothetical protein
MPWSFGGSSFAVAADGPIFDEWFPVRVEHTQDAILGSSAAYVDIGATVREPMALVAQFTTTAARDAIEAKLGTVDTLADDDGRECQALLSSALPIRVKSPGSGFYRLAITFVYVEA